MKRTPEKMHLLATIGMITMLSFAECTRTDADQRRNDLDVRVSRLVQVPMHFDASKLPPRKRELLKALVEATGYIHEAYLQQVFPGTRALLDSLAQKKDDASLKLRRLIVRNGGPFDKMDEFRNFFGSFSKLPGAAYYPVDLIQKDFESYVADHPQQKEALLSSYTVILRDGKGLRAIPYHEHYGRWIRPAAELLKKASSLAENPSLRKYLASRAEGLLTDDYFQSDCDWIDLHDSDIDIVIAPYEVYEDGLMGIKASYESTVGIRDSAESQKLIVYTAHLDALEQNLPHDRKYKRSIKGLASPMVVVTDIIRGGDIATGYQPVAANLPNDPKVQTMKGTKKTFWKNMMTARVNEIILPLGRQLIASDQVQYITPQGVFNFVLMHELCHALGPQYVFGRDSMPTNQGLKEHYPAIEEGKADVAGLHSIEYFIAKGIIPRKMEQQHYVSYLASLFRTIRFGTTEAHGKAAICELNFLRDRGGILLDPATKKWSVNMTKIGPSISELAKIWLECEATGDVQGVEDFFRLWASVPGDVRAALDALSNLPVDVEPVYSISWE